MSRIGSSSGVRVAATPLSNVYTVLLLIGTLVLVLTLAGIWVIGDRTYGVVWGLSDVGKANLKAIDTVKANQEAAQKELDDKADALKQWPAGMVPPVPGATTPAPEGTTPPAAPAAPATPPAAPATPPAAPAEKPAEKPADK